MVNETRPTIGIRVTESGPVLMAPDFLSSANSLIRLLSEVDIALSPSLVRTADWSMREMSRSSPAILVLEPLVREGHLDDRRAIVDTVMEGLAALKEKDIRPSRLLKKGCAEGRSPFARGLGVSPRYNLLTLPGQEGGQGDSRKGCSTPC